ncbi:four-carbon acid sugar kinase family protein [Cryobacterium sp. TMT4-10]|uniref:four-carbon acid sugar kinase family protein n=1 Tax=Cryobacterium sp. TMT4-10 TaxID=1259256 RepID=UPI001F544C4B|nr:four-carbon acid sugar kinase family protein [Cryobacterium sp. TMT4-10]
MKRVFAIADDLSGAAETAAAFMQFSAQTEQERGQGLVKTARIVLVPVDPGDTEFEHPGHTCVVFDSDSRRLDAKSASVRLEALVQRIPEGNESICVFLKVDSLLRGHMSSDLGVLLTRGPVVLAPALPALGRGTIGGVVHIAGVPLHESSLWSNEGRTVPATIAEAIAPLASLLVELSAVRGGARELGRVLGVLAEQNAIAICDAETAEDLDLIVAAAMSGENAQLAGSSALGAALFRALDEPRLVCSSGIDRSEEGMLDISPPIEVSLRPVVARKPVLFVIGTTSAASRMQLEALAASGVCMVTMNPAELLGGGADSAALRTALLAGPVAVSLSATEVDAAASRALSAALAEFVSPFASQAPLVLTGGETARAVLNSLNIHWLEPLAEIEHGAVLSRTDRNTLVVTRPGSFGGPDSLCTILDHIHSYLSAEPETPRKAH